MYASPSTTLLRCLKKMVFEKILFSSVPFLPRVPEDQESVVVAEEAVEEGEKKETKIEVDGADVEDVEVVEDGEDVEEGEKEWKQIEVCRWVC